MPRTPNDAYQILHNGTYPRPWICVAGDDSEGAVTDWGRRRGRERMSMGWVTREGRELEEEEAAFVVGYPVRAPYARSAIDYCGGPNPPSVLNPSLTLSPGPNMASRPLHTRKLIGLPPASQSKEGAWMYLGEGTTCGVRQGIGERFEPGKRYSRYRLRGCVRSMHQVYDDGGGTKQEQYGAWTCALESTSVPNQTLKRTLIYERKTLDPRLRLKGGEGSVDRKGVGYIACLPPMSGNGNWVWEYASPKQNSISDRLAPVTNGWALVDTNAC
ncbi:hypothetical protein JB92DRAFT_2837041 [Gautieria morchelliformis]|nr:hypothetical protein JB92DRAFT_2837041 [Gautieria morchelliformis]